MKFEILNEQEFMGFALNHEQASFHQTVNWGNLKAMTGWESNFVGIKENNKVIAASLILAKKTPIGKKMFYAPRGFLIDYNNIKLLTFFTKEVKLWAKKNKAIFIKIDPYISYQERDLHGNIVEGGKNNKKAYKNLISLRYKHMGFNVAGEEVQPRWIFITPTKDTTVEKIMEGMDAKTRQILRKNERNRINVREIGYDELDKFKAISEHTAKRRGFLDRPLSYYQTMYKEMDKNKFIKILLAEIDTKSSIKEHEDEISTIKKEMNDREIQYNLDPSKVNKNKYDQKQEQSLNEIKRIEKNINHLNELKEKHGDIITLGGILFYLSKNEVLSSVGGSYDEFMEFQSAYTLHWAGLKYAIENNYERYNFYGISGIFDEKNPLFGLYSFKRDFGGKVVELIGEFDLVVDKFAYFIYNIAIKIYYFFKSKKI